MRTTKNSANSRSPPAAAFRALGISCVTNAAAGVLDQPLDHNEVLETAERVKSQFIGLLRAVIPQIAAAL